MTYVEAFNSSVMSWAMVTGVAAVVFSFGVAVVEILRDSDAESNSSE